MTERTTAINRIGCRVPGKAEPAYVAAEVIYDHVVAPLLAEAERRGAEKALREAAFVWAEGAWADQFLIDRVEDDVSAVQATERWLVARADEIGSQP